MSLSEVTEKKLRSCHESANNEMTFSNYQGNLALTEERFQSSVLAKDCELQKSLESSGILFTVGNVDRDIGRYSGR